MNRKLKQIIKLSFDTQKSTRKDEFLQSLSFPKARYSDFVLKQISYIRKRAWIVSSILLLSVLCGLRLLASEEIQNLIGLISSLFPFVTLVTITEISRSAAYNMAELEMSCKYSLSDIILIRLCAIGGFNFFIFISILSILIRKTDYGMLRLGVYIFTPFMLSCVLSLAVMNYLKTRETIYVCGCISCFVSILYGVFVNSKQVVFAESLLFLWYATFLILLFATFFQTVRLIKRMEELGWNLQLTD